MNSPISNVNRFSFDGRVKYVEDRLDQIFAAAEDPLKVLI